MTVNTKGIIATPFKDAFAVCAVIEGALNRLILNGIEEEFPDPLNRPRFFTLKNQYSMCEMTLRSSEMVQVHLTYKGQFRTLSVFFYCDCDHRDIAPETISMSLGSTGHSVEIMTQALTALSVFGPAYLTECDSRELPPALLPMRLTVLDLVANKFLSAYDATGLVEKLAARREGLPMDFEKVVGTSETLFTEAYHDKDYETLTKNIKALALAREKESV